MSQTENIPGSYKYINPQELLLVLGNEPLWYKHGPVSDLRDELIDNPQVDNDKDALTKKAEFIRVDYSYYLK